MFRSILFIIMNLSRPAHCDRFVKRFKCSKVNSFIVESYDHDVSPIGGRLYSGMASFIRNMNLCSISNIARYIAYSKIFSSIIKSIAIDVVNDKPTRYFFTGNSNCYFSGEMNSLSGRPFWSFGPALGNSNIARMDFPFSGSKNIFVYFINKNVHGLLPTQYTMLCQ